MRFPTKIAIALRDDLEPWQRLNVTAFLASAIAAHDSELIGEQYADADDVGYLAMFRQPVMIYAADGQALADAHRRALARGVPQAIFTAELFHTGNDADNRAAVRAVPTEKLDLVGLALHAPRNAVDKVLRGTQLHT